MERKAWAVAEAHLVQRGLPIHDQRHVEVMLLAASFVTPSRDLEEATGLAIDLVHRSPAKDDPRHRSERRARDAGPGIDSQGYGGADPCT